MVFERIRQKQEEEAKAERKRQQDLLIANQQKTEKERQERLAKQQKEEQERQDRRRDALNLINQSKIIGHFRDISQQALGGIKHDIITDLDYATITLVWGKYHINKDNRIDYSSLTRVKDYSYIEASFNLNDQSLKINGKRLARDIWQRDQSNVMDAIATAYLHPQRAEHKEGERSGGGSSSISSECCCS